MQPESGKWAIVPIDIVIESASAVDRYLAIARDAQKPGFFDNSAL